jgi:ABC-type dipeptide/oligopeptide/nickel transport system permease subunit
LIYIGFLTVIALGASFIAPHNALKIYPGQTYRQAAWIQTPQRPEVTGTLEFPLGTDAVGRDVFSRLVFGTRTSLVVGFIPMIIILTIGSVIGLVSGFAGGWVDGFLMRFADIVYSFPSLLFFIIVMAALKDTPIGKFLNGFLVLFSFLMASWCSLWRSRWSAGSAWRAWCAARCSR